MYCSKCGLEINENDKFCSTCGRQVNIITESTAASYSISDKKPIKEKNGSNNWSVIIIISLIGLAMIYGPAFMDGTSSNAASAGNSNKYYEIIVDSQGKYEYSQIWNEDILVNSYFDITNIGTAGADNVQVDYSLLFDGRVLSSSTIYLGSISAGSNVHREKSNSVTLTDHEWTELGDKKIEVQIGEIRGELQA